MARSFADLKASYKRYDPHDPVDGGYGSPDDWKRAFEERMGLDEAQEVLGTKGPRAVLGVSARCTWEEVRRGYRAKMLEFHPDRIASTGLSPEMATRKTRELNAAYAMLAKEFGK